MIKFVSEELYEGYLLFCTGRQMVPGLLLIGANADVKLDFSLSSNTSAHSGIKETPQITHPPKVYNINV